MVWLSKTAVVTLPVEIDIANADQIREDLLSILNRGAATLVVDMGGTTFCDSAGMNALVRAFKRASANSAGMRLVVSTPGVRRVLAITGVDRLIDVYPTAAAALAVPDPVLGSASQQVRPGGEPVATAHAEPDGCPGHPG